MIDITIHSLHKLNPKVVYVSYWYNPDIIQVHLKRLYYYKYNCFLPIKIQFYMCITVLECKSNLVPWKPRPSCKTVLFWLCVNIVMLLERREELFSEKGEGFLIKSS